MPRPPSSCGRQHGHVQSASMVAKSLVKDAWRRFKVPVETMALPKRWRRSCASVDRRMMDGGKADTYGGSRGPDTVEHVGSEGDGHEEIFRVAHAHDVARFVLREPVRAGVHAGFSRSALISLRDDEIFNPDVHFTVRNLVFPTR